MARATLDAMAQGFEESWRPLGDAYLTDLLARPDLIVLAALVGDHVVGGLTAHVLPMTRAEEREVFIYDLAIAPACQRRGAGAALVAEVRAVAAAIGAANVFVPTDVEDVEAVRFYRAIGGDEAPVAMFTFLPR
ncbi:MAG: GNAT family N-acetyltransferase [Gemmatimonadota bacterium]